MLFAYLYLEQRDVYIMSAQSIAKFMRQKIELWVRKDNTISKIYYLVAGREA